LQPRASNSVASAPSKMTVDCFCNIVSIGFISLPYDAGATRQD
jgi:hypothetical protein